MVCLYEPPRPSKWSQAVSYISGFIGFVSTLFAVLFFFSPESALKVRQFVLWETGFYSHYVSVSSCLPYAQGSPSSDDPNLSEYMHNDVFDLGGNLTIQELTPYVGKIVAISIDSRRIYSSSKDFNGRNDVVDIARKGDIFYIGSIKSRKCVLDSGDEKVIFYAEGIFSRR